VIFAFTQFTNNIY